MKKFKQLPKSALIKNYVEAQNYLRENYHIEELGGNYPSPETHPYLMVAISNSNSGYLYYRQSFWTERDYNRQIKDNPYVCEFDTPQQLYDYLERCFSIKQLTY